MQLFFSIWEFRSQQISSSTENVYLVKTSVIFTFSTTPCAAPREDAGERKSSHMRTGSLQGQLGRTYYVYSGGFKRIWMLCIEGECLRWCGAVMAWSTVPFGSHTNASLEIWAYLKWNHTYVMKKQWYPQVLRSCMLFSFWLTSLGNDIH